MKAGTIITCPNDSCGTEQLLTTKDVPPGGRLSEAGFESLGFDLVNSQSTRCYKCGEYWYRKHPKTGRAQIHTLIDKWIPLGEPVKSEKTYFKPDQKLFI